MQANKPFAGGKAFATPYSSLGTIYSSNITADRETGIGAWSETDFLVALRKGVAPDGSHLFPAFPYTQFTKVTDADAMAIFAYLKTLPAVHSRPPENSMVRAGLTQRRSTTTSGLDAVP